MAEEWVDYEGERFVAPFLCMCCGVEVDVRQWAFGRACGLCDTGACQPWHKAYRLEYAHENPPWKRPFGTARADAMAAFIEHAHVEKLSTKLSAENRPTEPQCGNNPDEDVQEVVPPPPAVGQGTK